ncbi:ABC transporter permease subunit [Lutispora thermophila]|uniref:ABC-2 family transporter protein n=1 Tax=Lutispora thermophila DSM 19022 TaxID=1122184 RepID=A0A1M6CZI8_9FIRM|nr:ABC transporter permease subunit [Lutispora thermophila]SHI66281.1 hypothetical protein SAMN02745176_00933 [Lutispora thermophila DSM 19022]
MNSFCELVKFEYRKILKKRSTVIILILGILLTAFSCVGPLMGNYYIRGEVYESNYEGMKKDREYARGLSGREINSDLLSETIEAYSHIPIVEGRFTDTDEYQQYARPYSEIQYMIRKVYNIDNFREMFSISKESLDDFYTVRQSMVEKIINNTAMNSAEKANSLNLSRKVKTPFIYSYAGGYTRLFSQMYVTALIICFICSVCIAPLFAGEYTDRADSLILSSKYGKNKIIHAKLFTGISFTVLLCIVLTIVSFVTTMIFFGWDGSNSPIQLFLPLSIVPYTMGKIALMYSILILFASILSSALTMLLSAKFRSPFMVVVIMTVITVLPGFVNISEDVPWIYHLSNLVPARMFKLENIINIFSIEFLGLIIQPYVLILSFAVLASMALLPFAYRSFKNHNCI